MGVFYFSNLVVISPGHVNTGWMKKRERGRERETARFRNTEVASMCNLALTAYYVWLMEITLTSECLTTDFQSVMGILMRTHCDARLKDGLCAAADSTWTLELYSCNVDQQIKRGSCGSPLSRGESTAAIHHVSIATHQQDGGCETLTREHKLWGVREMCKIHGDFRYTCRRECSGESWSSILRNNGCFDFALGKSK